MLMTYVYKMLMTVYVNDLIIRLEMSFNITFASCKDRKLS